MKFIIFTPAKDEEKYINSTIQSILSQSLLPDNWIIIDDGSKDKTGVIAQNASKNYSWISVVRRERGDQRNVGKGVASLVNNAIRNMDLSIYDFIFKIDADIILPSDYFRTILAKFQENPVLGIAGGTVYDNFNGTLVRIRELTQMTHGAIKCWRRKCFEEIGGLVSGQGWDGMDCLYANMLGWEAKTFEDDKLKVIHMRPMGSSIKNRFHGWARHGKGLHFMGAHPIWVLCSGLYHMLDRPYLFGGLCIIIGYLNQLFSGSYQLDDIKFRKFVRNWQEMRLAKILKLK